jgi:uncharacterized protein
MLDLPSGLGAWPAFALIALSFVTSLITATFSLGGGSLLISVLALVFPPVVVVPVHGCIQLGSNAGRSLLQRRYIQWPLILWLVLGAVIGSVVGGRFATLLPERWFTAAIGVFVLATTWLPQPKAVATSRWLQFAGGVVISALAMVVGAAGPLVAVFMRGIPDRRQLVATHAMLMTFQHTFKVAVFVAMGFAFGEYLLLILLMVASGFAGTALGSRWLVQVPEHVFRLGFRVLLSLVAIGLIWKALMP